MKINELEAGSRKVDIEGTIVEKKEVRDVNTKNGATRVCNCILEDDSGTVELTLWGDEIEEYDQNDKVKVENGFVSEWNGNLQLSAGKYGKITKL